MRQLHSMQQDSINWLDARKRVELHISRASAWLESWPGITYTVDDLKKQNAELKVGLQSLTSSDICRLKLMVHKQRANNYRLINKIPPPPLSGLFERSTAVAGAGGRNQCPC